MRLVTLIDLGAGALPAQTPAPARFARWFPVVHQPAVVPPVDGAGSTPVADGVLLEWDAVESGGAVVIYVIERSLSESGPWEEVTRTTETRYLYSDGTGQTWYFRITATVRGQAGGSEIVVGTPELVARQQALDQEIADRLQGDLQTAQAAAADATAKADAARDAAIAHADVIGAQVADILDADEWTATAAYPKGDLVKRAGKLYRALRANTNKAPESNPADWQLIGNYTSLGEAVAASIDMATQNASDIAAESTRLTAVSASLGGKGANLLPAQYSRLTGALPPLSYTALANVTAREVIANPDAVNGLEYHFIDTGALNSNRIYFSPTTTGYNLPLGKAGKFIVSFWARSAANGVHVRAATRFSGTNGYAQGSIVELTTTRTRYASIIDIGSVYDACNLLLMPALDGVPVEIWTDGWMIEEAVNGNETPSAFIAGSDYSEAINARVTAVDQASVTRDEALASRTSAVEAKVPADGGRAASEARVVQAEQAAATANSATAGRVGVVEARMPAGTGALATEAQAAAAANAAQAASDLAGGKGKVIYGSTAPGAADRLPQNLWIDTTSNANTPKRWNGTAWVVVTDKVATDAAAAAAAALAHSQTVDARVTTVENASVSRDNALGSRIGVVEVRMPTGTDKLANEARVVAAETAAANANSATAQQVTQVKASLAGFVGIDDPSFESGFGWSTVHNNPDAGLSGGMYYSTSNVRTGLRVLAVTANTGLVAAYNRGSIPCSEGEVFRVGAASRGLANPAGASWQLWVVGYARAEDVTSATDKRLGYLPVVEKAAIGSSWLWEDKTGTITIPAGWGCFRVMCRVSGALAAGYLAWDDVHVERVDRQLAAVTQSVQADVDSVTGKFNAAVTTVLDVNGNISGTRSENDGTRSSFSILATVFRVLTGGAASGMEWQANYIRIYGNGYQMVLGTGFGANSNLVQWFGPNIGVAACTTANCTEAKTITGETIVRGSNSQGRMEISATAIKVYDTVNTLPRIELGL